MNCIAPGFHVGTRISDEWGSNWTEDRKQRLEEFMVKGAPMRRVAQPSELKGLVMYLASDASGFVTGQTFVQDGGHSL